MFNAKAKQTKNFNPDLLKSYFDFISINIRQSQNTIHRTFPCKDKQPWSQEFSASCGIKTSICDIIN